MAERRVAFFEVDRLFVALFEVDRLFVAFFEVDFRLGAFFDSDRLFWALAKLPAFGDRLRRLLDRAIFFWCGLKVFSMINIFY